MNLIYGFYRFTLWLKKRTVKTSAETHEEATLPGQEGPLPVALDSPTPEIDRDLDDDPQPHRQDSQPSRNRSPLEGTLPDKGDAVSSGSVDLIGAAPSLDSRSGALGRTSSSTASITEGLRITLLPKISRPESAIGNPLLFLELATVTAPGSRLWAHDLERAYNAWSRSLGLSGSLSADQLGRHCTLLKWERRKSGRHYYQDRALRPEYIALADGEESRAKHRVGAAGVCVPKIPVGLQKWGPGIWQQST